MLTKLKEEVQALLEEEAKAAHRIGLTPDIITVIGLILALLTAYSYIQWQTNSTFLLLAFAFLLFSGFSDALDGIVARLYQQTSIFGGFLDSVLDRYADAAIYISLILAGLCDVIWGLIAVVGSFLVSYTRARAEAAGIRMESVGILERAERLIILLSATLIAVFWRPVTVINIAIILIAIFSNLTVLQRSYYAFRKMKEWK